MRLASLRACIALFVALALVPSAAAAAAYSNWAALVVSGDWHAHDGRPSGIFDNARRDVTRDLLALGFSRDHVEELSARPNAAGSATAERIAIALRGLSRRVSGGCLLYLTSHGSPDGILVGTRILRPSQLAEMLNASCADRPSIVIVSACFSGVFVPVLAAPNRMILTAARRDRTSFGCGQTDRYPFFDQCVLSVWPHAHDFLSLGRLARACVAGREKREDVGRPSEPQIWIGNNAAQTLPEWR